MIEKLKKQWREFKASEPGSRFEDRYQKRKKQNKGKLSAGKVGYIGLGILCTVAGLVLMPAPGPGSLLAVFGLAMLGSEFLFFARALDWAELRLRSAWKGGKKLWKKLPLFGKFLVLLVAGAAAAAVGYGIFIWWRGW